MCFLCILCCWCCNTQIEENTCSSNFFNENECLAESTDENQIDYRFIYYPVKLNHWIDELYDTIRRGKDDIIMLPNYGKIQSHYLKGIAIGYNNAYSFQSYVNSYAGITSEKFELRVSFEIDSILSSEKADRVSIASSLNFLVENAEEVWQDSCIRSKKLRSIANLYSIRRVYKCTLSVNIAMNIGGNCIKKSFIEPKGIVYATGLLEE